MSEHTINTSWSSSHEVRLRVMCWDFGYENKMSGKKSEAVGKFLDIYIHLAWLEIIILLNEVVVVAGNVQTYWP